MKKTILALGLLVTASPAQADCGIFWECSSFSSLCKPHPVCDTPFETPPEIPANLVPPIIKVPKEPAEPFDQYQGDAICRRAYICNDYRNCAWEILCR